MNLTNDTTIVKASTLPAPHFKDNNLDIMNDGFVNLNIPVVCCLCRKIIAKKNLIRQFLIDKSNNIEATRAEILYPLGIQRECCIKHFVSSLLIKHVE